MADTKSAVKSLFAPRQLATPTDLKPEEVRAVTETVNRLIADAFALYVKTKNFHWHVASSHFRDYDLLLDEPGRRDLRLHRYPGGAGATDRWHDDTERLAHRRTADARRRQRGLRASGGDDPPAPGGQSIPRRESADGDRGVRPEPRHAHGQPPPGDAGSD